MKKLNKTLLSTLALGFAVGTAVTGCGDDDNGSSDNGDDTSSDESSDTKSDESTSDESTSASTDTAGNTDESTGGNTTADGGATTDETTTTPDGGSDTTTGGDDTTGEPVPECDLTGAGLDREAIPLKPGTMTLTNDKIWTLEGITLVDEGEVLTIEPCTRIEGEPGQTVLVIGRGGMIMAEGEKDHPILFTSWAGTDGEPGDWGGIILLGKAPNNQGDAVSIEGLPPESDYEHGGSDPEDNSGVMKYVRIEYPGILFGENNEVNGLTMGSVGSGTEIHHIMVSYTLDDCFEWFGGAMDAHHLVANHCGDDMFDTDQGFTGNLSTLFGRAGGLDSTDPNGWECDNNPTNPTLTPRTNVTSENVTLCGTGDIGGGVASVGAVLRRGFTGTFSHQTYVGFHQGVSLRDPFGTPEEPSVTLTDSQLFDNFVNNIGAVHTSNDFEVEEWFNFEDRNNEEPDPAPFTVEDCQDEDGPNAEVTGSGLGAFREESNWMDGRWVNWAGDE